MPDALEGFFRPEAHEEGQVSGPEAEVVRVANAVLKKTGDEGKAVRIANAAVKRKKRGKR